MVPPKASPYGIQNAFYTPPNPLDPYVTVSVVVSITDGFSDVVHIFPFRSKMPLGLPIQVPAGVVPLRNEHAAVAGFTFIGPVFKLACLPEGIYTYPLGANVPHQKFAPYDDGSV